MLPFARVSFIDTENTETRESVILHYVQRQKKSNDWLMTACLCRISPTPHEKPFMFAHRARLQIRDIKEAIQEGPVQEDHG